MAQDPRKRQQKLARKNAKRKSKQQLAVKQQNPDLTRELTLASKCPVLECVAMGDPRESGITSILLSRRLPNGSVGIGCFLVDLSCLGIKDAWAQVVSNYEYLTERAPRLKGGVPMAPATARKLVEEAVVYARNIGFEPHPEYRKAKLIFGDIDAGESTEQFEFGQDGKPFFMAGPNDTQARCRQIINTLNRTCGVGNFEFTIPIDLNDDGVPEIDYRTDNASYPLLEDESEEASEK